MFEKKIIIQDKNTERLFTRLIWYLNRKNSDIIDLADGDTTPSVKAGNKFRTNNTSAVTITQFDDGENGQGIIVIAGDGNTTINSSNFKALSVWSPTQYEAIQFVYDGTYWIETGRQ